MIASFGDKATEDLYHGRNTRRSRRFPPAVVPVALRKLDVIRAAQRLLDLRSPPGNRLETMKGDYLGWYSIRVNQQWRIIFRWEQEAAHGVTLTDYH